MINTLISDFFVYSLIPVNIIVIVTFFLTVVTSKKDNEVYRTWMLISCFFVAFFVSVTVLCLNTRPMAALGLLTSSIVMFSLGTVCGVVRAWWVKRADFQEALNIRLEEILKKKARDADEVLKRHGL
jgi:pheromone shutdown protein TraB